MAEWIGEKPKKKSTRKEVRKKEKIENRRRATNANTNK